MLNASLDWTALHVRLPERNSSIVAIRTNDPLCLLLSNVWAQLRLDHHEGALYDNIGPLTICQDLEHGEDPLSAYLWYDKVGGTGCSQLICPDCK